MNVIAVLLFLLSGFFETHSLLPKTFYHEAETMPHAEANTFCKAKYTGLAIVSSVEDLDNIIALHSKLNPSIIPFFWIERFDLNSDSTENATDTNDTSSSNDISGKYDDMHSSTNCNAIDAHSWKPVKKKCLYPLPMFCYQVEGKRASIRLKLGPDGPLDFNDPIMKANLLAQINEKINNIGLDKVVKVRWLTQKERKKKQISNSNPCL